jgi:putative dimethyl sulfoxide reductase chaperone
MTGAVTASPVARATWARLLALGFTAPREDVLGELTNLALVLETDSPDGAHGEALADLVRALSDPSILDRAPVDYTELFDGEAPCAPYEGSYARDPFRQVREMSDVAGFYAAFGAAAAGPDADRPDHVACELEFLSFVALRGMAAREAGRDEDADTCADAEDAFMRDHLGRWLGAFCERVAHTTTSPLYSALGRLGAAFADEECERRGVAAERLPRPQRRAVEADELTCGAGGACGPACAPAPPGEDA